MHGSPERVWEHSTHLVRDWLAQLGRFGDVDAALAGSPPDPIQAVLPEFEQTEEGRFAVLPNGDRIPLVAPRRD